MIAGSSSNHRCSCAAIASCLNLKCTLHAAQGRPSESLPNGTQERTNTWCKKFKRPLKVSAPPVPLDQERRRARSGGSLQDVLEGRRRFFEGRQQRVCEGALPDLAIVRLTLVVARGRSRGVLIPWLVKIGVLDEDHALNAHHHLRRPCLSAGDDALSAPRDSSLQWREIAWSNVELPGCHPGPAGRQHCRS